MFGRVTQIVLLGVGFLTGLSVILDFPSKAFDFSGMFFSKDHEIELVALPTGQGAISKMQFPIEGAEDVISWPATFTLHNKGDRQITVTDVRNELVPVTIVQNEREHIVELAPVQQTKLFSIFEDTIALRSDEGDSRTFEFPYTIGPGEKFHMKINLHYGIFLNGNRLKCPSDEQCQLIVAHALGAQVIGGKFNCFPLAFDSVLSAEGYEDSRVSQKVIALPEGCKLKLPRKQ